MKMQTLWTILIALALAQPAAAAIAPLRPDLTVTGIAFTPTVRTVAGAAVRDCDLRITIRNIGSGALPVVAYDRTNGMGLQIWIDGAARGGGGLWWADPTALLKPAGGTLVFNWAPGSAAPIIGAGPHKIKVVIVDPGNLVTEADETNNEKTVTLRCGPAPLPVPTHR